MRISSKLNELKPVDLNCNVFDVYSYDGLSMQDLLCQFFTKINECIKVSNETIDLASWLVNEGLKIEVVNKLMIWLEDGTLENLINVNLFNTLHTKIENINTQLTQIENNIIVLNSNMTTSDINEKLKNGGYFIFKRGEYLLNENESYNISSYSNINFEDGAKIKYNFNSSTNYVILNIENCTNVTINNAHIIGCKDTHIGMNGEWGYGIEIASSQNIKILNSKIEKTWGDGIYIGYKWETISSVYKTNNILIDNCCIYDCSRSGLSICSGDNIRITNCKIEKIDRVFPKTSINIEPENYNENLIHLGNVYLNNNSTDNCVNGIGLSLFKKYENCNIEIFNHISRNGLGFSWWEDAGLNCNVKLVNCDFINSNYHTISITNKSMNANLSFDSIRIKDKSVKSTGEHSLHSAIIITSTKNDCGNIKFSNISINTENSNDFSSAVFVDGNKLSTLNIDRMYCGNHPLVVDKVLNPKINVENGFVTSYYLLERNGSSLYRQFVFSELLDYSFENILSSCPDGEYETMLVKPNSYSLTYRRNNFTFHPINKDFTVSTPCKINYVKDGDDIYFVNLPNNVLYT